MSEQFKSVFADEEQLNRYGFEHFEVIISREQAHAIIARKKGGKRITVYVDPQGEKRPKVMNLAPAEASALVMGMLVMGQDIKEM